MHAHDTAAAAAPTDDLALETLPSGEAAWLRAPSISATC
jgi:hypothetical protein